MFLGETHILLLIIIIIIIIIIISADTPLVSNSFHFSWNPKYMNFGIKQFWLPVKVEILVKFQRTTPKLESLFIHTTFQPSMAFFKLKLKE